MIPTFSCFRCQLYLSRHRMLSHHTLWVVASNFEFFLSEPFNTAIPLISGNYLNLLYTFTMILRQSILPLQSINLQLWMVSWWNIYYVIFTPETLFHYLRRSKGKTNLIGLKFNEAVICMFHSLFGRLKEHRMRWYYICLSFSLAFIMWKPSLRI